MNVLLETGSLTPDDLLNMKAEGTGFELVDGRLVEINRTIFSCLVSGQLFSFLTAHCQEHRLGWVFVQGLGFEWGPAAPNTVRKPDAAFIRRGRLPTSEWAEEFCHVVPDLAVDIVSPNDEFNEVDTKVEEYLPLDMHLVWVVSLETRQVYVHRRDGTITKLRDDGELSGEDVVPDFRCRVKDIFSVFEDVSPANGRRP